MSKYRFRLETLQKLRIAQRDQLRASLADGYRAEQILGERQAALAAETVELRKSQRSAIATPHMNVNQLVEAQRYALVLQAQERQFQEQATRLAVEVERRRLAVVEADRGVRALDKLDGRRRAEHRKRQGRVESRELDEVAGTRHVRNNSIVTSSSTT